MAYSKCWLIFSTRVASHISKVINQSIYDFKLKQLYRCVEVIEITHIKRRNLFYQFRAIKLFNRSSIIGIIPRTIMCISLFNRIEDDEVDGNILNYMDAIGV